MENRNRLPVILVDDEEEILFGAEYLGSFHRLIDHHPVGHLRQMKQLKGP